MIWSKRDAAGNRSRPAIILGGFILAFVFLSCHAFAGSAPPPVLRGELRIVDKRRFDARYVVVQNTTERLVEIDRNGALAPRLATAWRWTNDRTLELTLRKGVRFHNGEVFSADIVKRNWDGLIALRQDRWGGDLTWWAFAPEARLDILGPYRVRLVLPEPDVATMAKLAYWPMTNQEFYRKMGKAIAYWRTLWSPGPWGTGPYQWVKGPLRGLGQTGRATLEANPNYWDAERFPRLKRITIDNALERKQAAELIKTTEGQVDILGDLRPLDTLRVAQSPHAKVIKERGGLRNIMGLFNMRKPESPWRDTRLRRAVNMALNRAHLIRYGAKGNGVAVPSLLPPNAFGYDSTLKPYAYNPAQAKQLLHAASYPLERPLKLLAPQELAVQATVVSKMLEQIGFAVRMELIDPLTFRWRLNLYFVPARKRATPIFDAVGERHNWDIALTSSADVGAIAAVFPTPMYHTFALDGAYDWVVEQPQLRTLHDQLLRTVAPDEQRTLIHQMERHTRDQAYFLFLYNLKQLYAVNRHVTFEPHPSGMWFLETASVTDQHWSMREPQDVSNPTALKSASPQINVASSYHLIRPEGDGPFPAVMLLSSCTGFSRSALIHAHYLHAAERLRDQGYVVLFVDFIGTRDLQSCRQGLKHEEVAQDIIDAAAYLRSLPFVKASAINALGWWFGGESALVALSAMREPAAKLLNAIITYYPACRELKPWTSDVPVLMLSGALDDMNPPADCQALNAQLSDDLPVTLQVFPEARNAFDFRGIPAMLKRRGFTQGSNPKAAAAAWREALQFLKR